jgi:osmotically inducible lipoprotein OsmB
VAAFGTLTVRGSWNQPVALDQLRGRLMQAHARQLGAEISPVVGPGGKQIRFPLAVSR